MEWFYYDDNQILNCNIIVFDDGNEKLIDKTNKWKIIATNKRGKYRLINIEDNFILESISCWKVNKLIIE
jgi:hypothetical protein